MILDSKLQAGDLLILDGGIGSEIERLGGKMHNAAWCGVANLTDPDIVSQVHESYLSAGVDIVTANTFANCRHVLVAAGLGDKTVDVNRKAVELARNAIKKVAPDREVALAGSMSNHVAWTPGTVGPDRNLCPSPQQESENYEEVAMILAEEGCDFLIMEMMTETYNSVLLIEAAKKTGLPIWVGLSASRGTTGQVIGWDMSSEEEGNLADDYSQQSRLPLADIIDRLNELGPQVMGIMHSSFKSTTPALDVLFKHWDGPIMAYPEANGYDAVERSPTPVGPEIFADYCRQWVENGVQIIGGCCGTTVHHIRSMVDQLPDQPGQHSDTHTTWT